MHDVKKQERILRIFYRFIRGEELSVKELANEYGVSTRSISRDLEELKTFLADNRLLVGNIEMQYNYQNKRYQLRVQELLQSNELLAIIEILIGSRGLNSNELKTIISKLKRYVSCEDRKRLDGIIRKEVYQYCEVAHKCKGVIDYVWNISSYIAEHREITIMYNKMDKSIVTKRIRPQAIIFSEFYFYLIAYPCDKEDYTPVYYRLDRIISITAHRENFLIPDKYLFDEGEFRKRVQFMWPGQEMKVCFEFTGPSVQAVLDRIPTAQIVRKEGKRFTIEAEVLGEGIKMYLLSQGAWVKVLSPENFLDDMKKEIDRMYKLYN